MLQATASERKTDFRSEKRSRNKMKLYSYDNIKMAEILSNRKSINMTQVYSENKSFNLNTNIKMTN